MSSQNKGADITKSKGKKKSRCRRDCCSRCLQCVCGPKMSMCGFVISSWGIIQLTLMGLCCHIRSLAFAEDFHDSDEKFSSVEEFYETMEERYGQAAVNCWLGAALFVLLLVLCGRQLYRNSLRERSKLKELV